MTDIVGARVDRDVHFDEFLKVLKRQGTPRYLPFYERFARQGDPSMST